MVLQAVARLWYRQMLLAAPATPAPRNGPVVTVGEGPADRVLMVGNGPLHGWGVTRRELSAPGCLAEVLHRRSLRAVTVEYLGDERMNAASSVSWLGGAAAQNHDVVVVAMGMNDALRLTRLRQWRRDTALLLDRVLADSGRRSHVVVVGLPNIRRYRMADSWLGAVAQRRARAMSAVLQQLAEEDEQVSFVPAPLERFEPDRPLGSAAMYRAWAEEIADHVLPHLDAARLESVATTEQRVVWEWSGTPDLLASRHAGSVSVRLEAVVAAVQERYGVAMAAVNLVDGERTHFVAGAAGAPSSIPRDLAYCDTTVRADQPLVVLDAQKDPRFRGNPFLDVVRLPFYAGVPLHALDGRAVATLCVLDTAARKQFDIDDLRRYAALAELELRRLEATRPGSGPAVQAEPVDA